MILFLAFLMIALWLLGMLTTTTLGGWLHVLLVVAVHHRVGRLDIGEASIVIAAASAHRGDAFAACRYAIERVKQIAPIWKREFFDGGDVWIEGATANPDDARARAEAERVACA